LQDRASRRNCGRMKTMELPKTLILIGFSI
jgi:hypothetical protein